MASAAPILIANRLLSANRTPLANDNTNVTGYNKANPFIVVFQIDEEKGPWSAEYQMRWRNVTDGGSFSGSNGEMAGTGNTDLTNDAAVTSKACQASGGSGSTWQNGKEVEYTFLATSLTLSDEYYTEFHFGVSSAAAHEGDQYEFQLWDYTNSAAIGTGAAKLTIASDQPSVVLNTADAHEFGTDTTPTVEFTGTDAGDSDIRYQVQIDTVNTFDSTGSVVTVDSYSEVNHDSDSAFGSAYAAQSFEGDGSAVNKAVFYLKRDSAWEGSFVAEIYAHSGTYGNGGLPTGDPLATSEPLTHASVGTTSSLVEFTFSTPYTVADGTYYFISLKGTRTSGSGDFRPGEDLSSSTHPGNSAVKVTSWSAGTFDRIFYVKADGAGPLLDKLSGTDNGFANTTDGADTDPFDSGDKCSFTVQAGDELSDDTYYWRVRGMDPAPPGSGTWGAWADYRYFTVAAGGGGNTDRTPTIGTASITGIAPRNDRGIQVPTEVDV